MSRRRFTQAKRKRAAAERAARRECLSVLLARTQRGAALTPAEARLLRAHVETEIADGDAARRSAGGRQAATRRAHDRLDAAHAAIEEIERDRDAAEARLAAARDYLTTAGADVPADVRATLASLLAVPAEATA